MACKKILVIAVSAALLAAPSARAQGAGEPTGVWLTQAGDARVKVSKCGGGICGVIVGGGGWWLASMGAPAWTLFALVGAAMVVYGLGTALSVRLTRWGQ